MRGASVLVANETASGGLPRSCAVRLAVRYERWLPELGADLPSGLRGRRGSGVRGRRRADRTAARDPHVEPDTAERLARILQGPGAQVTVARDERADAALVSARNSGSSLDLGVNRCSP